MNKGNFEHREKMNEMLVTMSEKNAEQNDKQNKTLEASITKMQESNEKKLDDNDIVRVVKNLIVMNVLLTFTKN